MALRVHPILLTLAMVLCSGYLRLTRRFAPRFLMGITAIAVMLAAFGAIPALATTYTVTSLADSGAGSLRNAIASASSGDTINFSVTGTITLAGTLTINTSLTISGAGVPNVAISGNNSVQVFSISGGTTVTISGVTIENGNNTGGGTYGSVTGGGIYNAGTLTLSNSTVSGNTVSATGSGYYVSVYGGGIYNAGTLTLSNSTISGNTANGGGNDYYGGVTGGGLYNAGTLTLSNSTISGNFAISANDFYGSVSGGGISNGGTLTAKNSIVANNPSGGNCAGTFTSQGYNLSDDATCASSFTQTGDLNSTPAGLYNILQNNGGPTQTIALFSTSPAVDAIPVSPINYCTDTNGNPVTTDQRGVARPQGPACDIGAFELNPSLQAEAWGYNNDGELGNGTTTDSDTPVQVNTLSGLTAIAGGDYHSLALKSDGTVWTWGENAYGELGNGTLSTSDTPVQVLGPGGSGYLTGVVAIAGIGFHSLALRSDGTVWAWGDNGYCELGNGTTTNSDTPVQVLGSGGSGYLTGIVAIAGGIYHSLALRSDGTVWTWGYNYYGAPTNSNTPVQVLGPGGSGSLTGIVAIAGGSTDSLALKNDGTVWAWGYNEYGELGNGTFTTSGTPVQVVGPGGSGYLTGVVAIAGGSVHSLAVKGDGTVWAWGHNEYGELGNGTLTTSDTPVQVLGPGGSGYLTGMVAVAGAVYHSLALKSDGTVWAWGNNAYGELGNGTFTESETPVQVSGLSGAVAIAGGDYHSLALAPPGATKLGQTISFTQAAPANAGYNSTFPVAAQSTSGLTVTLSVDSGSTSVCSLGTPSVASGVTSATVTMLSGTGTCTIFAIQSGNASYSAAALQQTSAVAFQELGQTISFTQAAPATASYYSAFPVAAQSTSGLTVTLSVDAGSTSVCSLGTPSVASGVTSATVAMQSATGVCTIDANQSGNGSYNAATQQQTSATATAAIIGGTLTVTNTNDSGFGSLRDAMANAASGDTINFSLAYPATITLASTLTINTNLTISGPGASNVAISGNNAVQVFSIGGGITVNISGVTIQNGSAPGYTYGGGFENGGTLTLSNSTVSGNSATYDVGAIYNYGTLTLSNSTVSGNSATYAVGGIYNPGTLTLTNSTVSGNSSSFGGGIYNQGTLTLSNSTVSGNSASDAGGIYNYGTLTLTNSTVSGNSSSFAGGIYNQGPLTAKNSIVANNSGGNCALYGTITSQGYNLSDDASCAFAGTGDMNSTAAGLDPGGLKANGGPTQTIALLGTSPAVDAIPLSPVNYCTDTNGNPVTSDQRGVTRPQGPACDIGAFELNQAQAGQTSQTISFTQAAPASATYNSTFPVAADSTSGLMVTLSVDSISTGVCSLGTPSVAGGVTSATVTMLSGTGTCTIFAIQSGNASYKAAALQQTSAAAQESGQTISFTQAAPATASYYSAFPVAAQSTSGLTVTLSVDAGSTSVCSLGTPSVAGGVTSAIVAMQSATGVCTIDANQSGNGNYTAAAQQQTSATATAATIGGTFTVTNTNDSGFGSLRDAMANAASGDTINFSLAYPATITLASTLTINTNLTISGPGASNVAISGNNAVQVFSIGGGITVNISGVTIQNGSAPGYTYGGGFENGGTLTLSNSTVSGNSATYDVGAIYNYGTLTLSNSTVSGNSATYAVGGIYNPGTLTLTNSTVSGNSSSFGGGIYNQGTLTLSNSTVSGNSASDAGGIYNYGTLTLTNSTVSGNSSSFAGGIYNQGPLTAKNSIVANNSGGNCALYGTITSQGYNLSDDASCAFAGTGDMNSTAAGLDPGGLKANGGPTQTIALLGTSPAVDAIPLSPVNYCTDTNGNPVTSDQRGVTRPQGQACDIGAFEMQIGIYAPVNSSTLTGTSAMFQWYGYPDATAYWLDVGKEQGGNEYYQSGSLPTSTSSETVNSLPIDGSTVWARWYYMLSGTWQHTDYSYTAFGGSGSKGVITSPAPSSTLSGSSVTFTWSAGAGATQYWLDVGSTLGGQQYATGNRGNVLSTTVNGLPTNGSTIYVTLYSLVSGTWLSNAYTYTAYNVAAAAGVLTTPAPGTTLTGSTVTFDWTAGASATAYWLDVGSTLGGQQYTTGNLGNVLTKTVSGLPTDGSTIYVTLYSLVSGNWLSNAYTYTAYNVAATGGVLTTPAPGTTLTSGTVTFDWTAGAGATAYWLDVGSTAGGQQFATGNLNNVLTKTVSGLPTDGSTIYVTLYSLMGGVWSGNSYTYTALNTNGGLAVMQTPAPGATLSGKAVTFTWSADANATQYWLDVGSTPAGQQYATGNLGNVLSTTVHSLPADGSTIYTTLYSLVGGQWLSTTATYVSGP